MNDETTGQIAELYERKRRLYEEIKRLIAEEIDPDELTDSFRDAISAKAAALVETLDEYYNCDRADPPRTKPDMAILLVEHYQVCKALVEHHLREFVQKASQTVELLFVHDHSIPKMFCFVNGDDQYLVGGPGPATWDDVVGYAQGVRGAQGQALRSDR